MHYDILRSSKQKSWIRSVIFTCRCILFGCNAYDCYCHHLLSAFTIFCRLISMLVFFLKRDECGFPGITEFQCVAVRGCCWDGNAPFRVAQCYQKNGAAGIAFDYDNLPAAFTPGNIDFACLIVFV